MKDLERATGVGREAIRFYIREGLLPEPTRLGRNVALYDEAFVERIRLIKRLQSERFLPLAVIKGLLGAHAAPTEAEVRTLLRLDAEIGSGALAGGAAGTGAAPARAALAGDAGLAQRQPEPLAELARRTDVPTSEIREIERTGAIDVIVTAGRPYVAGPSIEVVELWGALRDGGYTKELGFDASDLALSAQMAEWHGRELLRRFTGRIAEHVDPEQARRLAEVGLDVVPRMTAALQRMMLLRLIARGNVDSGDAPASRRDAGESRSA